MAITTIIEEAKVIHKEDVIMVKVGIFYHVYGKDSFIISYLMGYKLNCLPEKIYDCGFPEKSLNKVKSELENKKINYIILDRRNNYEKEEEFDNKGLNRYKQIYAKARQYINLKQRIINIQKYLEKNINNKEIKNKIGEIEKILTS